MAATPHPEVRVEYDQACIGCSYALRGLPVAGVCPECGMAVVRSFRGDRLSAADPDYVRELLRGATLLLAAAVVTVAIWVGAIAVLVLLDTGRGVSALVWTPLLLASLALAGIMFVAGAFRISAADPEGLDGPAQHTGRMLARPGAICASAGGVAAIGLELAAIGDTLASALAITATLLGLLATAIGLGLIFRNIARRSGERQLVKRVRALAVMLALAAALLAGGRLAGGATVFGLGSLLVVATTVGTLGLLEQTRAALKRNFAAARLRRASIPAPSASAPPTAPPQPAGGKSGTLP